MSPVSHRCPGSAPRRTGRTDPAQGTTVGRTTAATAASSSERGPSIRCSRPDRPGQGPSTSVGWRSGSQRGQVPGEPVRAKEVQAPRIAGRQGQGVVAPAGERLDQRVRHGAEDERDLEGVARAEVAVEAAGDSQVNR